MIESNNQGDKQKLIVGKYQLISKIGAGAMGEVYEGRHLVTEERVAVKLLTKDVNDSEVWLQRFNREATAASKIGHPGITKIHDAGFDEAQGRYYLAMDFLDGETFGARVSDGRISLGHSLLVVYELLDALSAAHNSSVIHRDVKPENIFIQTLRDGSERVKLLDFGIAKVQNKPSATVGDVSIGTPYYMSPEQARAMSGITYRTDIWSVGVILYWLIAGHPPFMGESSYDIVLKACAVPHEPIPKRSGVPPRLVELIEACLQKEPEKREFDAQMLRDELEALISDDATWKTLTQMPVNLSVLFVSRRAHANNKTKASRGESSSNAPHEEIEQRPKATEQVMGQTGSAEPENSVSATETTGGENPTPPFESVVMIPSPKPVPRKESGLQRPSSLPQQASMPLEELVQESTPRTQAIWGMLAAVVLAGVLGIGYRNFSEEVVTSAPVEIENSETVSARPVIPKEEAPTVEVSTGAKPPKVIPPRPALKTIKTLGTKKDEPVVPTPVKSERKRKTAKAKPSRDSSESKVISNGEERSGGTAAAEVARKDENASEPKVDQKSEVTEPQVAQEEVDAANQDEPQDPDGQLSAQAEPTKKLEKAETEIPAESRATKSKNNKQEANAAKEKASKKKGEKRDESSDQDEFFSF